MAKVTFLGLGVMGYPMARHIAKAGHEVTVYNRTTAKAEKWVKEFGGKFAKTPKEASKDSDFVFCCVGNDNDLKEVTLGSEGAFHSVKKRKRFWFFRCPCFWGSSRSRKWSIDCNDWWRK